MNFVSPLKDPSLIEEIGNYLWKKHPSYGLYFYMGVNTAFRVSDLIRLQVGDVVGSHIEINERKTRRKEKIVKYVNSDGSINEKVIAARPGRRKKILIVEKLRDKIHLYFEYRYPDGKINPDDFIFINRHTKKHISRQMAQKICKKAAKKFNLKNFNNHSLRKTFGYFLYTQTKDIALVMDLLNHASMANTLKYLGLDQEAQDQSMKNFNLSISIGEKNGIKT